MFIHDQQPMPPPSPPRLLDQVRQAMRAAGHDAATTAAGAAWVCRFIFFHNKRHPRDLGRAEVGQYLEHVAQTALHPLPALDAAAADAAQHACQGEKAASSLSSSDAMPVIGYISVERSRRWSRSVWARRSVCALA
jgi:hypothetical protein